MKAKFSIDRVIGLLVKSYNGKLDVKEQAELDEWLSADEAHRVIHNHLSDAEFLREQYVIFKNSAQSGLDELKNRMSAVKRRRVIVGITRWAAVSAATILLFIGIFRLAVTHGDNGNAMDDAVKDVLPGRNEAFIELETGEKIVLDENESRSIRKLADLGVISGDSLLQYNIAPAMPHAKTAGKHTFSVPKGANVKTIVLSDGTSIWLNAGSSITYPVRFSGTERQVAITGECFFDVAGDVERPFTVKTQDVEIRVTGTQFNVISYADEPDVETTLVSGSVSISASGREVALEPGTQAVYNKDSNDIALRQVDARIYTAWKDGMFVFNDMSLADICHILGRWYDIEFVFGDYRMEALRFHGTLKRNHSLTFILDRICETNVIGYKMEEGKVIITERQTGN